MPKNIALPDGRIVEFPDQMDDAAIGAALSKQILPAGAEKTGLPGVPVVSPRPQEDHAWQKALPDFIRIPLGAIQAVGEGALGIASGAGDAVEAATGWEQFGGLSRWWNEAQKKYQGGYRNLDAKPLKTVEGTLGLVGSGVGSSMGFMLPGLGVAKGVGMIDKVGKLSAGAKLATQLGAGVTASSALETIVDAGAAYRDVMEDLSAKRASRDVAREVAWETVKREFPATVLSNAAEFLLPGVGSKRARAILGLMFEGGQEVIQGEAQRAARASQGLENHDVNQTRLEEFVGGAAGGAVGGWLMGGGHSSNSQGETIPVGGETNQAATETNTSEDDPTGPGGETPAAKSYTPDQYAQALELTMKREKAASPTEIRKALGTDYNTTKAMLQQMQDEGFVKLQGPKGRKFWRIVKRPEVTPTVEPSVEPSADSLPAIEAAAPSTSEASLAEAPSSSEVEQLDPLRPNVYEGEPQPFPSVVQAFEPDKAKAQKETLSLQASEPSRSAPTIGSPSSQQTSLPQQSSAAETSRPERDPSLNDGSVKPDGQWNPIPTPQVDPPWKYVVPTFVTREQQAARGSASAPVDGAQGDSAQEDSTDKLISSFAKSIAKNESLGDIKKFMQRVERETGRSAARGEIKPKEAYDIMETAVNRIVAEQGKDAMKPGFDFGKALTGLRAMMKLLPTQSSRSETQVKFQQFSTPPTLAYLAARLAAPTAEDTVLEPSAGTGGLASWAKAAGAKVVTNEIDPKRTDLLKRQGYEVTSEDGEQIHNILPDSVKPTVVLMNPPFSAAGKRGTKNTNDVGYRHVEQAFERLEPGGRLVVILGEGATLDAVTAQPFWKSMAAKGNIRANIGLDGKEYAKYGTTFGNRIAVIDKTGPTPGANWLKQRASITKGDFKTIEDAWDAVSSIAADRKSDRVALAGQTSPSDGSVRADSVQPEPSGGRKSAPSKGGSRSDRGGRAGERPASRVAADQSDAGDPSTSGKPAAIPAGSPVEGKSGRKLSAVADDAVPDLQPVSTSEFQYPKTFTPGMYIGRDGFFEVVRDSASPGFVTIRTSADNTSVATVQGLINNRSVRAGIEVGALTKAQLSGLHALVESNPRFSSLGDRVYGYEASSRDPEERLRMFWEVMRGYNSHQIAPAIGVRHPIVSPHKAGLAAQAIWKTVQELKASIGGGRIPISVLRDKTTGWSRDLVDAALGVLDSQVQAIKLNRPPKGSADTGSTADIDGTAYDSFTVLKDQIDANHPALNAPDTRGLYKGAIVNEESAPVEPEVPGQVIQAKEPTAAENATPALRPAAKPKKQERPEYRKGATVSFDNGAQRGTGKLVGRTGGLDQLWEIQREDGTTTIINEKFVSYTDREATKPNDRHDFGPIPALDSTSVAYSNESGWVHVREREDGTYFAIYSNIRGKGTAEFTHHIEQVLKGVTRIIGPDYKVLKPTETQAGTKPAAKAAPTEAEINAKHGELLKEAADAARERIRKAMQGNQLNSGLDPQLLLDLATMAAQKMHEVGIQFKKWSEPFVQELGEWVREHLQAIRDRAEEVYDDLRAKAIQSLRSPQSPQTGQSSSPEPRTRKAETAPAVEASLPTSQVSDTSGTQTAEQLDIPAQSQKEDQAQAQPTAREDDGGNVVYVPTKLPKSWGAQPHPGRIVETQSMAATDEPDIVTKPNISWDLVKSGAITEVQLTSVALAAQSHERFSADGSRQGFFIGDGTGVGKGREIAATILHHWNSGVKRMVWVSYKDDLLEDAKRDLNDLGAQIPIMSIKKFQKGKAIEPKFKEGIVFVAYTTLAQSAAPSIQQKDGSKAKDSKAQDYYRVQQLADWTGEDTLIVFDEAHKAKNAVVAEGGGMRKGKASAAGQSVSLIQSQLKKARVLYASATGFTDPTNIGYAQRLGLWGDGTAFPTFGSFNAAISKGGVGAMEMVSRDMKAQGKYVARFLSYAGVEFSETIHVLTPAQQEIFEAAGKAWRSVFKDIRAAMGVTGASSSFAERNAESQFWSANLRFYRAVLTAMKVPTLFREMDEALAAERSVIISVLGTGAAATDRALSGMLNDEEGSLDDLDVSPADILKQFVEKSFPIYQYEVVVDENGQEVKQLVKDSQGNPVINKEAQAMRDMLLKDLDGLKMPEAALDQIVNRYGAANVAELTGRNQRILEGEDGKKLVEKRKSESGDSVTVEEARLFQEGKKRIAIISNKASTGISLHADRRAKNQQRRFHIILELKWSADDQMQDFGRSHRTNEISQPIYKLLSVNVGADKRFSSSIARRLEQLGALSRGDRASSGAGDIAKYNFETNYGKAAVKAVVDEMNRSDAETLEMMGLKAENKDAKGDQIPVTQFLNRLMSLPLERQNRTFDRFMEAFQEAIETAKRNGMFDAGAEKIQADKLEMVGEPTVIRTDDATGARTLHYQIEARHTRDRFDWEEAKQAVRQDHSLMRQKNSGRLIAVAREAYNTKTALDGSVVPVHRFFGASGSGSIERTDFEKYEPAAADKDAQAAWDEQWKAAGPYRTEHVHLIGGSVLPIYDRLGVGGKPLKVEIAQMPDGQRILGVRIPTTQIKQVMRSLGHGVSVTPAEVLTNVLAGETYELAGGLKLKKLLRAGQERIEVVIASNQVQRVWSIIQPHGGFNENIQYVFRYFLPNDERALAGVQALLKAFPVVGDSNGKVEMAQGKADGPPIASIYNGPYVPNGPRYDPRSKPIELANAGTAKALMFDGEDILVVNTHALHLLASLSGRSVQDARFLGGFYIEAEDAKRVRRYLVEMKSLGVGRQMTATAIAAIDASGGRGVSVVRDSYSMSPEGFDSAAFEELDHRRQADLNGDVRQHLGDDRSTADFLNSPEGRIAAQSLAGEGYQGITPGAMAAEIGVRLMRGGRFEELNLTVQQARDLSARYIRTLRTAHGKAKPGAIIKLIQEARKDPYEQTRRSNSRPKPKGGAGSSRQGGDGIFSVPGRAVSEYEAPSRHLYRQSGPSAGRTYIPGSDRGLYSRTFQDVLDKSEVRRLREKQKRTDTPDAEYRRILKAVSGQTGTKQLTKDQAQQVFDRLSTATVPIGAMLRSPSMILGRSAAGAKVYQSAEENWFLQERLNERWGKNWEKANKGTTKQERNRIALYRFASQITQMRDADSAREWLDSIGEDSSIMDDLESFLTPKEKAVNAKWTKLFFEPSRKLGIAEGLIDGKQQFDNYLSFYHDSTLRMNRKRIKDAAADLAREIGVPVHVAEQILEKANPKKVSFGSFDFTRQEWSIPGLRDADMIAEIYRKGFARKVAISRFLAEANPLTKKIVDPALRTYARRYIAQYAGKPQTNKIMTDSAWAALMSKIPILKNHQPSAGELAGWATAAQYNAKIGFNLFTPMLNLTQTVLNTMPYVGTRRTLAVLPRAMAAVGLPMRLNPFLRDVARLRRGGIFSDDPAQGKFDRPVFHGVAEHVQKAASFLFDKAESLNRATAYLAGLEVAKSEGLRGDDAVQRAREVVRVTQFYSGRLDAPLFSRTPAGQILMQFKTFTVKQLEFVGQLNRKQQAEFAAWTVALGGPASLLILQAFKQFFPDWEATALLEQWQESWNVAAWLQAGRLQYQMGVFTIPGLENVGSGRLKDRMGQWLMGPTTSTLFDNLDATGKMLKDPSKFDKWAESLVRGWAPGGVEWMRVKKAWEEAEGPEEALRILTGTDKR